MKRTAPSLPTFAIILALLFLTSSCRPAEDATAVPATPCPTPTASPHPTVVPTKPATRTPRPTPAPDYTRQFLDTLPTSPKSCHPDQTTNDLGIYIYDLEAERELVSINANVPFQFASAFKAPVLVYFLSACRQYWNPSSPQWEEYFQNTEAAQNVDLFTSPEYEAALAEFIANPKNWSGIGNFSTEHRQVVNDANGAIDTRYFVLGKVYGMIAQSSNPATAEVLQIVFENCLNHEPVQIEPECGGPNAITAFNAWFNDFSGITYETGTPRRGLHNWETIIQNSSDETVETILPTFGLKDQCANQTAILNCDPTYTAFNTLTARDFFKFYNTLYNTSDNRLREIAFSLLKVDNAGPARGYLKNLTRSMHAVSLSKNGHAFFTNGSINTDAGIVLYKGKAFIVVTLSFNALGPMATLYGSYDAADNLVTNPGLIQNLLEEYSISP